MFAKTFTEAVTRWRREQRPRPGESWYAVHYRSGWLIERMNFRESVELLRQGLDVRPIDPKDRGRKKRKRSAEAGAASPATASGGAQLEAASSEIPSGSGGPATISPE